MPGNNGMFDMVLAVDWVKDYIRFFGGNPNKIVAFGHGTGAASAMMLSLSKFCESNCNYTIYCDLHKYIFFTHRYNYSTFLDSFSGLIAMSGSILSHFAVDRDPIKTARYIARKNGCPTDDIRRMVHCLRELSVKNLIKVDSELENIRSTARGFVSALANLLAPGPVVEGADDGR